MSEDPGQGALPSGAEDAEAQAAAWFRRKHFWDWSEEDKSGFDLWLSQSPAHEIAYWRIMGAWSRTERLSALHRPMRIPEVSHRGYLPFIRHAVAGLVVASLLGASGWAYFSEPGERTFQTPLGGRQVLTFADGTQIELNTDTVLRARIDRSKRTAELVRGEAYFKVHHDAHNPLVVTAGGHRVVDLGTEFSIRAGGGNIRVSLIEGSARLEPALDADPKHSAVLRPGDVATANATSVSIARRSATELSNNSAWRRGLLIFKYTPLREAVAEINRYNDEKLVIADASVANRTVYGTISTQGVQAFVRVTRSTLGLHVEKRGAEFVISP